MVDVAMPGMVVARRRNGREPETSDSSGTQKTTATMKTMQIHEQFHYMRDSSGVKADIQTRGRQDRQQRQDGGKPDRREGGAEQQVV